MNIMRIRKSSRAGFTLVELIVVIAILAILAGVAIPVYSNYIKKANRAADETLLDAANTAFAAACLENGVGAAKLPDGSAAIVLTGKCITDVTVTDAGITAALIRATNSDSGIAMLGAHPAQLAATSADINASFGKYFAGNITTELKYYSLDSDFEFKDGAFHGKESGTDSNHEPITVTLTDAQKTALNKYLTSNYSGHEEELAQSMQDISGVFGDLVSNTTYLNTLKTMDVGFANYLSTTQSALGRELTGSEIANAAVMYVSSKTDSINPDGVWNSMYSTIVNGSGSDEAKNNAINQLFNTENGDILSRSALGYSMIVGYANSKYASDEFKTAFNNAKFTAGLNDDPGDNDSLVTLARQFMNDAGNGTQDANHNTGAWAYFTNEAKKDMNGYLSALSLFDDVNTEGGYVNVVDFDNDTILELINAIIANGNG